VVYKDTVIRDSFRVLMPIECHLDTIVNNFSVYLENGNIWVKWLGKIPERTIEKKTTHVVVDKEGNFKVENKRIFKGEIL
jgi:hypothetical protein